MHFDRLIFFKKKISISDSSKAFTKEIPLFLFSKNDFGNALYYFLTRIVKNGLPLNNCNEIFYTFVNFFSTTLSKPFTSIEDLEKQGLKGYLRLKLKPAISHQRLQLFEYESNLYYITAGVFILPQAKNFLESHNCIIKGFILDTTWRVMSLYVTSIITASFLNTSLPIGFAFGNNECKLTYQYLLDVIENEMSFSFKHSVILSDQGKSLIGLCLDNDISHITCLRHFLKSLSRYKYAYEISEIVQCKSEIDFFNAINEFSKKFDTIITNAPTELTAINRSLKKIGMKFENRRIITVDISKWNEVCMLSRIGFQMPSTSNSLESTHGHLNRCLPRNNSFWRSLFRLYEELSIKFTTVNDRIKHNYSYLKSKTLRKLKTTRPQEMRRMISYYETTCEKCNCSENKLESSIYSVDIPCSHRLFMGTQFPDLPQIEIILKLQYDQLKYEVDIDQNEEQEQPLHSYDYYEKEYAFRTIKFFSKYKKDDEIINFVEQNYKKFEERDGIYINGTEVDIIRLIEKGIHTFKAKKVTQ